MAGIFRRSLAGACHGRTQRFPHRTSGREKREHIRREVRLEAILLYLRKGIRGCMQQHAQALNISEGGCMITCAMPDLVGEHLYIVIAGIKAKIACAVVGRSDKRLNLRFGSKLPTELVDQVAKRRA
jgi:hypothetical protein